MAFRTQHIQIDGSINVDGSIFQFGQPFVGGGGAGDAWNGLTTTDTCIGLGGILTQPTSIDVSTQFFNIIGYNDMDPDESMYFTAYGPSPTGIYFGVINNGAPIAVELTPNEGFKLYSDTGNSISAIKMNNADVSVDLGGKFFIKDSSSGQGLQYTSNYSSTFIDRSLIDKGYMISYVDACLSSFSGGVSQAYVDGSLSALNASVNTALTAYTTNASANIALSQFVRSSSVGYGQFFNVGPKTFDISLNLDGLTDVVINNPSDNQILTYDLDTLRWVNQSTVDISTISQDASLYFQGLLTKNSPSSNSSGVAGQWCYDASYLYICTSTNNWMRILGVSNY